MEEDYEMPILDGRQMLEMIRAEKDLKTLPPQEIIKAVDNFFEKRKGDRNA